MLYPLHDGEGRQSKGDRRLGATGGSDQVSVFDSLLHGLDNQEQNRTRELIANSVAADRADAIAGRRPDRLVDSGNRRRRSRADINRH